MGIFNMYYLLFEVVCNAVFITVFGVPVNGVNGQ
jgi:hypothetical protein